MEKPWGSFRKAPDTFNFVRHVMRAILSVRPKCSHRCVSLKETPLKPVQILKHITKNSTEQTARESSECGKTKTRDSRHFRDLRGSRDLSVQRPLLFAMTPPSSPNLDAPCKAEHTMRAEIIAYRIYLEGHEYPEYVMHFFN